MEDYDTDDSGALAENDPYRDIQEGAKQDRTPSFQKYSNPDHESPAHRLLTQAKAAEKNDTAASAASKAESAATMGKDATEAGKALSGDPAAIAKTAQNAIKYTGSGKGSKGNGTAASNLKKFAPLIGIFAIVAIAVIGFMTLLSPLFHSKGNTLDKNNGLSATNASLAEQDYIHILETDPELTNVIGENVGFAEVSEENCADIKARGKIIPNQGLCPTDEEEDPAIEAYFRQKALENSTIATTNTPPANPTHGNVFKFIDKDGKEHLVDADNFSEYYHTNNEFYQEVTRGSKAWTGTFSGWFDESVKKILEKLRITRNQFQSYVEDADAKASYFQTISDIDAFPTSTVTTNERLRIRTSGCADSSPDMPRWNYLNGQQSAKNISDLTIVEVIDTCEDENGNIQNEVIDVRYIIKTSISPLIAENNAILQKNKDIIRTTLPNLAASFNTQGATAACNQAFGIAYFSATVAATRLAQAYKFGSELLEATDKTMAGLGHESPYHQVAQHLSTRSTYEYMDGNAKDENGNYIIRTSETNRPGLNASALSWINTDSAVDLSDPNIQKLSLEGIVQGFVLDKVQALQCTFVRYSGGLLFGLVSFLTGSSNMSPTSIHSNDSEVTKYSGDELIDAAIERAAYALSFNPCTKESGGEDVGNCYALGSHYYLASNHQISGGSPASAEKALQFANEQRTQVAKQAELERATRSPFDITSQHTFLGSIVGKILPYTYSFTGSDILTSIGNVVGSSINSLLPSASAVQTERESIQLNIGNCEYLKDIGAIGDAFCVPYIINDLDPEITNKSVKDIENIVKGFNGFEDNRDDNGNLVIREDSNFARYIKYCSNRTAMFGVIDPWIMADMNGAIAARGSNNALVTWLADNISSELANALSSIVTGAINAFNKIVSALKQTFVPIAGIEDASIGWSTGLYCVATDTDVTGDHIDTTIAPLNWNEETRYYQTYMAYQRIRENRMHSVTSASKTTNNTIARSNYLAIVDNWEEKTPSASSTDEVIAGLAGMTLQEHYATRDYIAYHASDRSTYGPILATTELAPRQFRRSITPLTDFLIDQLDRPPSTAPAPDNRKQEITA